MKIIEFGTTGTEIMKIQAVLKKIGYYTGPINGIFDSNTKLAIKKLQKHRNLPITGAIDKATYYQIKRLILGYDYYIIQKGDTLFDIAEKYDTTINKIITANPHLVPYNLTIGEKIIVPYSIDVVDTNINYTYDILSDDIKGLLARYPFLQSGSIGRSVLGRKLYYLKLGRGSNEVFYNAAHHSLEWITSPLLMKFIENFCKAYSENKYIKGYSIRKIFEKSSIYIVPMVNPDGIDLVLNGLDNNNPYYDDLIKWNKGSIDFSKTWQANIHGVDLNHNYDASWEESKKAEPLYGVYGPGPTRYSGPYPESEPESKSVADFTRKHNFRLVLAYHSQGEIIYWNYKNLAPAEALKIGKKLSEVSGYSLAEAYGIASYAGYKDWFIKEYRRPGYTIEVGRGKNPLPISQFDKIYADNEELLLLAAIV
ncbi:M14 family metallopeptidase [Caloranaerobacter azorensis]|uniref:Peptidase M14 n=2 Tax=Caloranaerobacter azorensis TaxID=116090 RepID=A0A096CUL2_9FIRM|nr:M14 family zinc carboxypeptidase [Caloranaerobacter azorensis]KGG80234.1 peptidase M14 [Caloranaerobacter azorensis H53214]QIB26806.1 LysM peptidoglycan-binding domain-containing protein [Caloranaerobacter azorensis]